MNKNNKKCNIQSIYRYHLHFSPHGNSILPGWTTPVHITVSHAEELFSELRARHASQKPSLGGHSQLLCGVWDLGIMLNVLLT